LTQALPRDKDLPLNDHHCPPIQEPKQHKKERKKASDNLKHMQKQLHNSKH
jgi:hypothetical protein